jgi:uncharacterized protein (TIRG00374 family)
MRNLLFAIALLLAVMLVIGRFTEVQAIADTLKRGDWRFLLLAAGIECIWYVNVAASFKATFQATGIEEDMGKLLLLAAAANFVNVVAPTAGMGGIVVFISEARRRGYSSGRVTVAGVLYVLFDYAGFLCVLALGLFVLFRRNNLNFSELIATGILIAIAAVIVILLYLGMRSAMSLGRALAWMARRVNWVMQLFTHKEYLSEQRAYAFAFDAAEGLHELRRKPSALGRPMLLALTNKALLVTILLLAFLAFKVPFSVGTLIAGFSIGYLFLIVSPTPSGIGIVEGVLTLVLSSLSVPLSAAAVIALAYRGITFWAPLLFGMAAFRILTHSGEIETTVG